jgi:hypothetical protein
MKALNINGIALACLLFSTGLMVFLFAESRNDPSLRIAALVAGTNLCASLVSIASTILTGKDVTKPRDPADLPPNSSTSDTTTIKVGPVPPSTEPATATKEQP